MDEPFPRWIHVRFINLKSLARVRGLVGVRGWEWSRGVTQSYEFKKLHELDGCMELSEVGVGEMVEGWRARAWHEVGASEERAVGSWR